MKQNMKQKKTKSNSYARMIGNSYTGAGRLTALPDNRMTRRLRKKENPT